MGQSCSDRVPDGSGELNAAAVSLERAKSLSSNAPITASRYRYAHTGHNLADDYKLDGKILGSGLCGDVVLVHGKIDNRKYALKTISKQRVSDSKVQRLVAEVEIYLTLDHPNIARLHDVYETEQEIHLITECCEGGELYYRLQKKGVYTDSDAAEATRHMLRAIGYLHSRNVVHRDLKLENFLYQTEDEAAVLKLIDFGFAKIWDPSTLMMASCGSVAYVSPDVLNGKGYTNKCDLWSLGVVVWMLLVGYPPFHGDQKAMMSKIKEGQLDWSHKSRWKPVSAQAIDFLKQLLCKDPSRRLDAQQALQHPWMTQVALVGAPSALSRDALRSLQTYSDASKARRAVLQLLAQELDPNETKELREAFFAIDKSNEGTICLRDLKEAIRSSEKKTPRRRRRLAKTAVDPNSFGIPSTGSNTPTASANVPSPESVDLDASLRTDLDASLMSNFSVASSGFGSPTTPARTLQRADSGVLDELFMMLDANGNERIYYSDFLAATMERRTNIREEAVRATFHRLDADGSGTISVEDFRNVLGETFEGVNVEELVREVAPDGSGIDFKTFLQVLGNQDLVPSSPVHRVTRDPAKSSREKRSVAFFPGVESC